MKGKEMANKKVVRIVGCDRAAGFGCEPKPPTSLLGKRVTVGRPLINTLGYWVEYKNKKYVLLNCEINECPYYGKKLGHTEVMVIGGSCGADCPMVSKTKVKEISK